MGSSMLTAFRSDILPTRCRRSRTGGSSARTVLYTIGGFAFMIPSQRDGVMGYEVLQGCWWINAMYLGSSVLMAHKRENYVHTSLLFGHKSCSVLGMMLQNTI